MDGADNDYSEYSRAGVKDEDYHQAALLLCRTYKTIKSEREYIRAWQTGERTYTDDDALAELISITPKGDDSLGVRVSTSGTSDSTSKIGMLLASGFAEKRQSEIIKELYTPEMVHHIHLLDWEIEVVETAIDERMTRLQGAIFQQIFVKGKTYSQIIATNKGKRKLNDWKINHEKYKAVDAVADELEASCYGEGCIYFKELLTVVHSDAEQTVHKDRNTGG